MDNVVLLKTDGKHKRVWPVGANAAFLVAAKYAAQVNQPFLWLEPDCVPTRKTWIEEIEAEYAKCGKRYMGGAVECKPPLPRKVLYGISVYDPRVIEVESKRVPNNMNVDFDGAMSEDTVPLSHSSKLFQHSIKSLKVNPVVALFHQDKHGVLISKFRQPKVTKFLEQADDRLPDIGSTGYHFGDRGDVIYSLPVCRLLGISNIVLCPHHMPREKMTRESAESLASLIREQPYIEFVRFSEIAPAGAKDLNGFRELFGPHHDVRFFYQIDAVTRVLKRKTIFRFLNPPNVSESARFEAAYRRYTGCEYALIMGGGGTSALVSALVGLGVGAGDEVIIPGYTYIATAAACLIVNAVPVICEVDGSLTMDPRDLERKITKYTRAIVAVHMRGTPCRMREILAVARKHKLKVLEDVAQANGGDYHGRKLGSLGDVGAFSLQHYKVITAGEGAWSSPVG